MGDAQPLMCDCSFCGKKFQMSHHVYDGKYLKRYDLNACHACYSSNHDGWGPSCEKIIISHLNERGLEVPDRNEKGWLPRD